MYRSGYRVLSCLTAGILTVSSVFTNVYAGVDRGQLWKTNLDVALMSETKDTTDPQNKNMMDSKAAADGGILRKTEVSSDTGANAGADGIQAGAGGSNAGADESQAGTDDSKTGETADGSGDKDTDKETDKEAYYIRNEEDFMTFVENCRLDEWSLDRDIMLVADLNLSGGAYTDFDGVSSFSGTFYGGGHTISGALLTGGTEAVGLFHYLEQEGTITGLNVNIVIHSENSADILGGIVGVNAGTIKNCGFTGKISGQGTTGGIAGYNGSSGTITDCTVKGNIQSAHTVGGVVGENRGVISDSVNEAEVNSDSSWFEDNTNSSSSMSISGLVETGTEMILNGTDIGGIAGVSDGIIAGCTNRATVGYLHTGRNVGGIAGRQSGDVINCKNSGTVYGKQDVGGVVGLFEPAVTYEDAEKLNESVDALHDDIDTLINDMDAMGDTMHSDLDDLANHADTATDTADALTTELREVIEEDVEVVNDLSSRVTYVVKHMPGVMDYVDAALNAMEALGDDLEQLKEDADILSQMEESSYDPAKNSRLVLVSSAGGSLSTSNSNPAEGVSVTITVKPENGYQLSALTVTPYQGSAEDVTAQVSGDKYSFAMPAENVTIQAVFAYTGDYVAKSNEGGRILLNQSSTQVRIRAAANPGYEMTKVTVGGTDITDSMTEEDGYYTVDVDKITSSEPVVVEGIFTKLATAHPVTVESSTGGTVTPDPVSASAGDEVKLGVSATRNYKLTSLTVTDASDTELAVTETGENEYTFVMPDSEAKVQAVFTYVPDEDTKVYAESTVGGTVAAVPSLTSNNYTVTLVAASGYEVAESGTVLEIYENGNDTPTKSLTREDLEENAESYTYTLNEQNYGTPIRVVGYFTEDVTASHNVTVISGTGGSVAANATRAAAGDTLKLAVTNEPHYALTSLMIYGEEIKDQVEDGTVEWVVPDTVNGDIEVVGTFSPVVLVITSEGVGGTADYSVTGQEVTLEIKPDTGYEVKEPLALTDGDGSAILYQKQYANSNIYKFAVTDSMQSGKAVHLQLAFTQMNDRDTVDHAMDTLEEDNKSFSNSLDEVSNTADSIRELLTDDFGEVRNVEDLSEEELDDLESYLIDLADETGDAGTYAASMLRAMNTITEITLPYLEEAADAVSEDLDQANEDYQAMVDALQGANTEARAIVDYLNSLKELQFRNLSENFDSNSEKLSAELDTIIDIMKRLNDHVDLYSNKIEEDMRVVNDRLNTIFDMILTRMDNMERLTEGKDLLEDHSADEDNPYDTSRITACVNSGKVNGDTNVGGVTGSIGREADEESQNTDSTNRGLGEKYITSAILQGCTNEGFVKVKTENGGGIAGNMSVGLVKGSMSLGSVTSEAANCIGGIAGYSEGTIDACGSKSELSGNEYIGGIAGRAHAIRGCFSMAYITDYDGRVGAISADYLPDEDASNDMTVYRRSLKDNYVDNYYVSSKLYGIDGVSYASVAEPVTYAELLKMEGVSQAFKTMDILFVDEDDNIINRETVSYGSSMGTVTYPQIQAEDGDYYEWEGATAEDIVESNLVLRAVSTANVTILQSAQRIDGRACALAEGVYTESAVMNVEEITMDVPAGLLGDSISHVLHVTIENSSLRSGDETKLRLLKQEEGDCTIYAYRKDHWQKLSQDQAGNYVQVAMLGTDEIFCMVTKQKQINPAIIGLALVGVVVILLILLLIIVRKKRKRRKE